MHPLFSQQLAQQHMEDLRREAEIAQTADQQQHMEDLRREAEIAQTADHMNTAENSKQREDNVGFLQSLYSRLCWRMKEPVQRGALTQPGRPLWTDWPGKRIHSIVAAIPCGHSLSVAHLISTRTVIRQQSHSRTSLLYRRAAIQQTTRPDEVSLEEIKPAVLTTFSMMREGGLVSEYDEQFIEKFVQTLEHELTLQARCNSV